MNRSPAMPISFVHGFHREVIRIKIWMRILQLALREYKSLKNAIRVLRELSKFRTSVAGKSKFNRFISIDGRYFWHPYLPGYPSNTFDNHFKGIINRYRPVRSFNHRLSTLFVGLTNTCPLSCQHCYDWQDLNKPGAVSLPDMKQIISKVKEQGVSFITFLGGEPMARFDDLIELIKEFKDGSEIWISSCGFELDHDNALELKSAGLAGVYISLDHFDKDKHNTFRGNKEAFTWAIKATESCTSLGIATCWSICATREFISKENLMRYFQLAASYHVNFIQIFEPMTAGRYEDKKVKIDEACIQILEENYIRMNRGRKYKNYPIVVYPGYHQRRIGCLGKGNRYLYVDAFGKVHPCPFCRSKKEIDLLSQPYDQTLEDVFTESCGYS